MSVWKAGGLPEGEKSPLSHWLDYPPLPWQGGPPLANKMPRLGLQHFLGSRSLLASTRRFDCKKEAKALGCRENVPSWFRSRMEIKVIRKSG